MMIRSTIPIGLSLLLLALPACKTKPSSRTARGAAKPAPAAANHPPPAVRKAIQAANDISGKPYKWGGGHAKLHDNGYDCSGTVSYVLIKAGLLDKVGTSRSLRQYGNPGKGKWITVWAKSGHVYMDIAGRRFDAGQTGDGPQWWKDSRGIKGFSPRHPPGL